MPKGPRRPHEPLLVGAADAAEILGKRQSNLRTVKGLPKPYQPREISKLDEQGNPVLDKDGNPVLTFIDKVRATTLWRADEIYKLAADLEAEAASKGDQSVEQALQAGSG